MQGERSQRNRHVHGVYEDFEHRSTMQLKCTINRGARTLLKIISKGACFKQHISSVRKTYPRFPFHNRSAPARSAFQTDVIHPGRLCTLPKVSRQSTIRIEGRRNQAAGISSVTTVPSCSVLDRCTVMACMSASFLTMARPRPVPLV